MTNKYDTILGEYRQQDGGGSTSVSNSNGTLTISPTTGTVVASLNLNNPNTWTGLQNFNGISAVTFNGVSMYKMATYQANSGNTYIIYGSQATAGDGLMVSTPNTSFRVDVGSALNDALLFGSGNSGSGSNTYLSVSRSAATSGNILIDSLIAGVGNGTLIFNSRFTGGANEFWNSGTNTAIFRSTAAHGSGAGAGLQAIAYSSAAQATDDRLGFLIFGGTRDGALSVTNSAAIQAFAGGNWTGSSTPSYITFATTPSGTTTRTEAMRINISQNVGIGATTISARLHVISTTEQKRIGYDASNYFSTTVGSTGTVTMDAVGAAAGFVFSDSVTISNLTSGRVPIISTAGLLTDDADLTFSTDTLTATKIVGTTSIKAGTASGYLSSDGSSGATGSFTTADLKTVTVKDGIITSIV